MAYKVCYTDFTMDTNNQHVNNQPSIQSAINQMHSQSPINQEVLPNALPNQFNKNKKSLLAKSIVCFILGLCSALLVVVGLVFMQTQAGAMIVFLFLGPIFNLIRFVFAIIIFVMTVLIVKDIIKLKLHIKSVYALMFLGIILWAFPFMYNAVIRYQRNQIINAPFVPILGDSSRSLSGCLHGEKINRFISNDWLSWDIICGAYTFKTEHGRMPTSFEEVKPFIMNEAVFDSHFEIVFDERSPDTEGVMSIVYNRNCGTWSRGYEQSIGHISAWWIDTDNFTGRSGMKCSNGRNF